MPKIIHIHQRNKHQDKLLMLCALLFGFLAFAQLFSDELDNLDILIVALYAAGAVFYLIYGLKLMRIPRVEVDENVIWFKGDIFSNPRSFHWDSIKEISFGSYEIELEFNDNRKQKLKINTSIPEISIAIKEAITEIANEKNIKVNPG